MATPGSTSNAISISGWTKKYVQNGHYQTILWLGVNGFIFINEEKKEILLVDPWPSYEKDPEVGDPRISALVDWLKFSVRNGFTLVGLVVTHEHFDHLADVPILLARLHARGVSPDQLPPLICDLGSAEEIKRRWEERFDLDGIGALLQPPLCFIKEKWFEFIELKGRNGEHLLYRDTHAMAGTKLDQLALGSFSLTPYVWDHASLFNIDAVLGDASGNLQRATALLISCEGAERTFLIGSAGEMNGEFTSNQVWDTEIETELLIQAMPHLLSSALISTAIRFLLPLTPPRLSPVVRGAIARLRAIVRYQKRNITVKNRILAAHFESFVLCSDSSKGEIYDKENQNRIKLFNTALQDAGISRSLRASNIDRFLIEVQPVVIEERSEGYLIHKDFFLKRANDEPLVLLEQRLARKQQLHFQGPKRGSSSKHKTLFYQDRFVGDPKKRRVHKLPKRDANTTMPGCDLSGLDFRDLSHFQREQEAYEAGLIPCPFCFSNPN